MGKQIAAIVKTRQFVSQCEREAALIVLLQPVLQPFAADLDGRTREQLVPLHRPEKPVVGTEIEAFGGTDQIGFLGNQQDRKLAEGLVGATLCDKSQWIAIRRRQTGDDQLCVTV